MLRTVFIITVLLMASVLAGAQAGPASHSTAANRPQFAAEQDATNLLTLGLGFSTSYDDNAFNGLQNPITQTLLTVNPRIGWKMSRHRWNWALDYADAEGRSASGNYYNRSSHSARMDLSYQATRTLTLSVRNSFVRSNDPFYDPRSSFASGFGLADQPNPSWFGVNQRTTEQVGANIDYQLSARTSAGVGGSFAMRYFDLVAGAPNSPLRDFNTVGGDAFVQHQFSPRNTAGISYDFRKLTSPGGLSTVSHRPSLYENIALGTKNTLSLFAGPQYSTTYLPASFGFTGNPIQLEGWSWSAGASYSWSGARTGFTAGFVHQTTDSAGFAGPVQLTGLNFGLQKQLARKWTLNLNGGWYLNDRLAKNSSLPASRKFGSADASLNWAVRNDLAVVFKYARHEQTAIAGVNGFPWIDRDRFTVSVNYTFTRPLGR